MSAALAGDWIDLVAELLGEKPQRNAKGARFYKDGKLSVRADGSWYNYSTGESGSLAALVHKTLKCDWPTAYRWLEDRGWQNPNKGKPRPVLNQADRDRVALLRTKHEVLEIDQEAGGNPAADDEMEETLAELATLEAKAGGRLAPERAGRLSEQEWTARRCDPAGHEGALIEHLGGLGIAEGVTQRAIKAGALGWSTWRSQRVEPGRCGHGGPAVAVMVRTTNPGHLMAVDLHYADPAANGGQAVRTRGAGGAFGWYADLKTLMAARTVVVVRSALDALSVATAGVKKTAAFAVRDLAHVADIDWRWLVGRRVLICLDNDEAGQAASWALHEHLLGMNVGAHLVEQLDWHDHQALNDILQAEGPDAVRGTLDKRQPWVIPGVLGTDAIGKQRVWLPRHDFTIYWRFRTREDFTHILSMEKTKGEEEPKEVEKDLAGFRIAALSRVRVQSSATTMSGEEDDKPQDLFAVSVQTARGGDELQRRVLKDEQLHAITQWQKFGPVFDPQNFARLVTILERGAHIGSRDAVNFVGLCWRGDRLVVNEGNDCYFSEPQKQCPYHNLSFPSGPAEDARVVLEAYRETFRSGAALQLLTWSLGGHLKMLLGAWPHMMMQADKGAGKSTLIKRLERSISMTMFGSASLETGFRLLTSVGYTTHPVGWEEISTKSQKVIDAAVELLQQTYQSVTVRRGPELTEFCSCAPVLLSGEDVPVRSLTGKLVRMSLRAEDQGPEMREDLPKFPVRQWLSYLASLDKKTAKRMHREAMDECEMMCRATCNDAGAKRMVRNYAALLVAWWLLSDFAGLDEDFADFHGEVIREMNEHIKDTSADREPWVWITESIFSEMDAGAYKHPWKIEDQADGDRWLLVRTNHIIHHMRSSPGQRAQWDASPVKSDRVYKRQLVQAGVVASDREDRSIDGKRCCHMLALSLNKLAEFGLSVSQQEEDGPGRYWRQSA